MNMLENIGDISNIPSETCTWSLIKKFGKNLKCSAGTFQALVVTRDPPSSLGAKNVIDQHDLLQ